MIRLGSVPWCGQEGAGVILAKIVSLPVYSDTTSLARWRRAFPLQCEEQLQRIGQVLQKYI
ncbi:MAG: hypothetical protein G8345_17735 [Magnetococcales bacterium]|nr:hypothetical protein [Magnetococcales bacterium]NGZ28719.1 hypothetical protein [Magnetococcales bacterium]